MKRAIDWIIFLALIAKFEWWGVALYLVLWTIYKVCWPSVNLIFRLAWCKMFGHFWGSRIEGLACGKCSDRIATCQRCGDIVRGPFFRKWWCTTHDPHTEWTFKV